QHREDGHLQLHVAELGGARLLRGAEDRLRGSRLGLSAATRLCSRWRRNGHGRRGRVAAPVALEFDAGHAAARDGGTSRGAARSCERNGWWRGVVVPGASVLHYDGHDGGRY